MWLYSYNLGLVFNTKYAYWFQNAIGVVKVLTLIFIIITGFVVLGGHTPVEDPKVNFRNAFEGTGSASAYGLTNALYRIIFSYGGYNNACNLANEVKVYPEHPNVVEGGLTVYLEPCPVTQEICLYCTDNSICSLHVRQCRLAFGRYSDPTQSLLTRY